MIDGERFASEHEDWRRTDQVVVCRHDHSRPEHVTCGYCRMVVIPRAKKVNMMLHQDQFKLPNLSLAAVIILAKSLLLTLCPVGCRKLAHALG